MVRSMIAGVAGLKAHQSKLDVIGNNIANVNTWGFKSYSYNFQDAMYSNSISSTGGSTVAGAAGGHNASQVGYGSTLSSISTEFNTGAPSPSSNNMDCMIDGTGFFLVGNMVNGTFEDVESSGLYLSRVGIFRVDNNGYLVDNLGSYVYGYGLVDGTGTPEITAKPRAYTINGAAFTAVPADDAAGTKASITIGGINVVTKSSDPKEQIDEWIAVVTADKPDPADPDQPNKGALAGYKIEKTDDPDTVKNTVNLKLTAKVSGVANAPAAITSENWAPVAGTPVNVPFSFEEEQPVDRVPGIPAIYSDQLTAIRIPTDPETGQRYDIQGWTMNEDGTIMGTDVNNRAIPIAQLALVSVENPNGLEKQKGYYYTPGANSGVVEAIKPNGGPVGIIKSGWLEMANVDLANEFSNMITTQRGFQANSKIITVTDEMLQELVNMKR